jgi:prepilin-type N-terminal cleavage/methylation domain-containing protein
MNGFLPYKQSQAGFTLLEMAVVMVILGVLLGGLITPLSTQRDIANERGTDRSMAEVYSALIGYAVVNGRLPCPATLASNGSESPIGGGACTTEHGFVPAVTLGLNGRFNNTNQLLDEWYNPIKYSLSNAGGTFQYSTGISLPLQTPSLRICRSTACVPTEIIADNLVAVIISRGKDGAAAPVSPDQLRNFKPENNSNTSFVTHESSESVGAEFDDRLIWISPTQLALPLVQAGVISSP